MVKMNPKLENRLFIGTFLTCATIVGVRFYLDLMKERPTEQERVERVMEKYDIDGNGELNREELSDLLKVYKP